MPRKSTPERGQYASGKLSQARILNEASRLFAESGFAAVSMRDIADACGVNLPSIYHFFGDKDRLYEACYRATFEAAANELHEAVLDAGDDRERIVRFTVTLCAITLGNHNFRRLLQREFLREEKRPITALTTHHFKREFKVVIAAIERQCGPGNAMERCFAIYGMVLGLVQLRRIGELAGMDKRIVSRPDSLARYVLSVILPELKLPRRRRA